MEENQELNTAHLNISENPQLIEDNKQAEEILKQAYEKSPLGHLMDSEIKKCMKDYSQYQLRKIRKVLIKEKEGWADTYPTYYIKDGINIAINKIDTYIK